MISLRTDQCYARSDSKARFAPVPLRWHTTDDQMGLRSTVCHDESVSFPTKHSAQLKAGRCLAMGYTVKQQSYEHLEHSRFVWGTRFGNSPAQIQSIGQALYNGAAGRATNSIIVIANGLYRSASLNRVGEVQRFSHNDILKARLFSFPRGWSCLKRSLPILPFFPFHYSAKQSSSASDRGQRRPMMLSWRLTVFRNNSTKYLLRAKR